ncbi:MAG: hypothetical protein MI743_18035, partial [Sneathiellales bacterium]|nr:hypothetical protein [Sneathiellales bacterium]
MAKTENGVVTGTTSGTVVEVEAGQNIVLEVANADLVTFTQDGSNLVVTSIADGTSVILEGFFSQAQSDLPPQLTLSDGSVISAADVTGLVEEFNPDLVAPAAGPAAGAAGGGGAGFGAYSDDGIGEGIDISGLLDPTELGFGGDGVFEEFVVAIPGAPELDLNEIGLGAFSFAPRENDSENSDQPVRLMKDGGSGDTVNYQLTSALVELDNPDVNDFMDFAGSSSVDFIELRNTTNTVQSTGGNGPTTVGEGVTTLSIIGPDGEPVSFDMPTVDIPAGGKLVVMQAVQEGEESSSVETVYVIFDADGTAVGGGALDGVEDWPMGEDTTDPLGVLLSWSLNGDVTELDTFLANGAQFEPASLNAGWLVDPQIEGANVNLDIFGDNGTFNGQIATQEVVAPGIFDAYAPISLEQLVECSPLGEKFFLPIEPNNIFARVDNADTDSAADWTTGQTPSVGDNNDVYDPNPQDPYNDDMNPGQGVGPEGTPEEEIDNDGQNVIVVGENDEDFTNEETGVVEGGRAQDFLIGGAGNDDLSGGSHNDYLDGGAGNDQLSGDSGGDVLIDDQGQDMLVGGTGTDILFGRRGNEEGDPGNDSPDGDGNNDLGSGEDADLQALRAFIGKGSPSADDEAGDEIGNEDGFTDHSAGDLLIGDEIVSGGWGNDYSYGNDGKELFRTALISDDYMYGGTGNEDSEDDRQTYMRDIIVAGDGHDIIYGDNAGLDMYGRPGSEFSPADINDLYYTILNEAGFTSAGQFKYAYRNAVEWNYGGADLIYGGWGDDIIFGQGGDDAILAGHGEDTVAGGSGDDKIRGNGGDDFLMGDTGDDTIYGDGGDDRIHGQEDDDLLYGGAGNDTMGGGTGDDIMYGDEGDDYMQGGDGEDILYGGSGNDEMRGQYGDDILYGGSGNDMVAGGTGEDILYGDSGEDTLRGGDGDDILYGGSGHDDLQGMDDDDILYGDSGNDNMSGGEGDDLLYGGTGADTMRGGDDDDAMYGDSGNDLMWGDDGEDVLYGGEGNDLTSGGAGDDILYGNSGDDQVEGGAGDDVLYGGEDNDRAFGGADDDTVYGGSGADTLQGNSGDDLLYGGTGNDNVTGQDG